MGIHTVKFIAEIQKRPCLWNTNLENYSGNKLAKQQAWEEVAQSLFVDWQTMNATNKKEKLWQIQKKWKGLRDYFARSRHNPPKNKDETDRRKRRKAPSLKMLQFLSVTKPDDSVRPEPESEHSDSSHSSRSKPQQTELFIETDQLITEIQARPCIWHYNDANYNEKAVKVQAWMEVAMTLSQDFLSLTERKKQKVVRQLQKRWKGLRDYFTRQKSKERLTKGDIPIKKRRAPYLEMLQFLDINKSHPSEDDSHDRDQNEDDSDRSRSPVAWCREQASSVKRPKKPDRTLKTKSIIRKRDPDMNFLLNILPDMKSMNARQNFDFRFEVMKLIKTIKYNQSNDCSYNNASGSSTQGQDMNQFTLHTSSSKSSGKPQFRHHVIIQEHAYSNTDGMDMQTILCNESAGSSVEDIKAILEVSPDEQSE